MPKKLTYEFVKEQFAKKGYVLLSNKYINAHQKLKYICPKGHKHSISWGNWSQRKRCPYCAIDKVADKNRLDIEFIKSEFEKAKYKLLTKKYKNAHQKLDYICPNGHKHNISWNSWRRGQRCPCFAGRLLVNIDLIRNIFEKEDYILLTTEYRDCYQKLDYICPRGHKHSIRWNDWQSKCRCLICYREGNHGSSHPSWKGGVSFEPYSSEFNNKLKGSILERDDHQCQNPDCWRTSERLSIHHIDYNKENCDFSNLITLCISCNSRANKNRKYWTKFYQEIMNEKYGYVYGK